MRLDIGRLVFLIGIIMVFIFLLAPIVIIAIVSLTNTEYVIFPPEGLSLRWFIKALSSRRFIDAYQASIGIALLTAVISIIIGTSVSFAIVRHRFRGKSVLNTLFLSPLMFPAIVLGIGLLQFGALTKVFSSIFLLVMGHLVITLPFTIRSVSAVLYRFDRTLEEAAMDLGADETKTFLKVTVPLLMPGLINGFLFAFIVSFENITISLFLSGPVFKTVPVYIYDYIQLGSVDPTIAAISTIIIAMNLVVFGVLMKLLGSTEIW